MKRAIFVALLGLSACARPLIVHPIDGAPAWAYEPDVGDRIERIASIVAEHFGPVDLSGWKVYLTPRAIPCGNGGGCTDWHNTGIYLFATESPVFPCIEATFAAHEMAHVAILDPDHHDARWRDRDLWRTIADAIAGGVPANEPECREAALNRYNGI